MTVRLTNLSDKPLTLTGVYGALYNNGSGGKYFHPGEDDANTIVDQKVVAPCDGIIKVVGYEDEGAGEYLVLEDTTRHKFLNFFHLKRHSIRVTEGQRVTKGTHLATIGSTGNSSGIHLHFEVRYIFGDPNSHEDPTYYINYMTPEQKALSDISKAFDDCVKNDNAKVYRDYLGSLTGEYAKKFPNTTCPINGKQVKIFPLLQQKANEYIKGYIDTTNLLINAKV